jgi:hypothetical protein
VYQAGNTEKPSQLLWLSPASKAPTKAADNDNYRDVWLSPDGHRLAVTIGPAHVASLLVGTAAQNGYWASAAARRSGSIFF